MKKRNPKYVTLGEYEKMRKLVNPTLFERIKNVFFHKSKPNFDFRKLL